MFKITYTDDVTLLEKEDAKGEISHSALALNFDLHLFLI
uniref:Uncharacterized protein n=1 Tax=Arundo donax TaxID=35708 RepID=A0A0A8YZY8_ARUDO